MDFGAAKGVKIANTLQRGSFVQIKYGAAKVFAILNHAEIMRRQSICNFDPFCGAAPQKHYAAPVHDPIRIFRKGRSNIPE